MNIALVTPMLKYLADCEKHGRTSNFSLQSLCTLVP